MCSREPGQRVGFLLVAALLSSGSVSNSSAQELLTAAEKPVYGPLDAFLGEPSFDMQVVSDGGDHVRESYLAVAVDGTLLAVCDNKGHLRRSENGGPELRGDYRGADHPCRQQYGKTYSNAIG